MKDEYFIKRELCPNIDYYSCHVLNALHIPLNMFNAIFAVTRSVGWISQWREMMSEPMIKIGRPRQLYVGSTLRKFKEIEERGDIDTFTIKHHSHE